LEQSPSNYLDILKAANAKWDIANSQYSSGEFEKAVENSTKSIELYGELIEHKKKSAKILDNVISADLSNDEKYFLASIHSLRGFCHFHIAGKREKAEGLHKKEDNIKIQKELTLAREDIQIAFDLIEGLETPHAKEARPALEENLTILDKKLEAFVKQSKKGWQFWK